MTIDEDVRSIIRDVLYEYGVSGGDFAAGRILTALEAKGCVIVPSEPTEWMVLAGDQKMPALCYEQCGPMTDPAGVYRAMLAARCER